MNYNSWLQIYTADVSQASANVLATVQLPASRVFHLKKINLTWKAIGAGKPDGPTDVYLALANSGPAFANLFTGRSLSWDSTSSISFRQGDQADFDLIIPCREGFKIECLATFSSAVLNRVTMTVMGYDLGKTSDGIHIANF